MPIAEPELDLPLADTPAGRFLTWIVAALIGAAVLALAVWAAADVALQGMALRPRLATVALPAAPPERRSAAAEEAETRAALDLLRRTDGVAFATLVPREELDKLVEPWLGEPEEEGGGAGRAAALPMPRLIDVGFNPGVAPDLDVLAGRLRALNPGARVEEADPETGAAEASAGALRLIAGGLGLAVLAGILVVVAVVTRMSLGLHADSVDLLRLMGAADCYVARQFEQHALASGLRGGLAGFAAGLALVVAFILLAAAAPGLGLPGLPLRTLDWVLLAAVPVVSALLTALTARLAARHGLSRLR